MLAVSQQLDNANKMLSAVSQLSSGNNNDIRESEMEVFSMEGSDFLDFSSGNLLDSIDFDDLFAGISDGDLLPDLEMDPEILAEFSISGGTDEESDINISFEKVEHDEENSSRKLVASASASELVSGSGSSEEEIVSRREETTTTTKAKSSSSGGGGDKGRKSLKNPNGKRKVKVDWTPELHRRFVQAVEQLGVDKAVPSRILELMGIDCLTRHNIASHLQKYRSHRKHLLAREAEAASWSQRRHMYGGGSGGKRDVNPWIAPTMGFPPVAPMPPPPHMIRPLHVWGHPSVDQSLMHMWPKHITPSPPPRHPPHAWTPPPPPVDPSFWMAHHQHVVTPPGASCYPQPARFPTPPVHGLPPPAAMYKVEPGLTVPPVQHGGQTMPQAPSDIHPSTESVDAAIGDVLSKPWLPLPLGLKPPSTDSVMVELQRQGISKVPPTCTA